MNFSFFQKPSRYINSEINSISRSPGPGPAVKIALAFPDTYEVGMSHLGMKILYQIINSLPYASAERFFSPWPDLEEYMSKNSVLLSSLESGIPLRDFDIAGFSLQYELSYTTVLNMLHLGGIPIRAEERRGPFPLVVAGGPCTVNPAPMAAFIDVFLIGDGEDAVVELADIVRRWKKEGDGKKESLLQEISKTEGFYVPSLHKAGDKVKRRFVADLDAAPYPVSPIVPYTPIVHDRIAIEVSRGCTMGCRFCQAGIIYRPLRERSPEKVMAIATESLKNTGHDELSFTSLSAGDYPHLLSVAKECNARFGASRIALSLPSLRVGSINRDVLNEIRSIRKTGFTMAPEAATARLRNVINKDFNDDDYERALKALFEEGWLTLKLYFMIGLPTERDEDIEAIKEMALKALKTAKKYTRKFVNINITVSPFIPKSHTPFQWCGQIGLDKMGERLAYLREAFTSSKLKYKGHNKDTSLLEAAFARGDEKMSALIEDAWKSGCKLDGWSEMFNFNKWTESMNRTGIDCFHYATRTLERDGPLPWDCIDSGIKKEFLYHEYERAISEEKTPDCRKSCTACGLKCRAMGKGIEKEEELTISGKADETPAQRVTNSPFQKIRVRVQFSKTGRLRYLSHLELVTALFRGLRRAEVPFDFSQGFHPSPKVSLGPSLNVGVSGEKEYFDMEVFVPFDTTFYMQKLKATMPEGISIDAMSEISIKEPSLNSFISRYEFRIKIPAEEKHRLANCSMPLAPVLVQRDNKTVDLTPCIENISIEDDTVHLVLKDHENIKVRIGEIAEALLGIDKRELDITRTALYGWKDGWKEPL